MLKIINYILAFAVTLIGVEIVRRWTIRKNILDIPNERSSHNAPTPRGGGVVIVMVCLLSFIFYQIMFSQNFLWSYVIGGFLIAFVSWLDDIYNLSIIWRFISHLLAAGVILVQMGFWDSVYLPILGHFYIGYLGMAISVLWIVWLTNAYNFMDGIDGISGMQAVTASFGWILVGYFWGIEIYIFFGLIIFLSSLGFLFHNWHPAKIFMGDVGSAFLGYTFAVLPFLEKFGETDPQKKTMLPLIGVLLVWFFVFDSVQTLFRRLFKGEKIWQAHRQHLYQILVIEKYSHGFVSGLYGLLSLAVVFSLIFCWLIYSLEKTLIALIVMFTGLLILFVNKGKLLTKSNINVIF